MTTDHLNMDPEAVIRWAGEGYDHERLISDLGCEVPWNNTKQTFLSVLPLPKLCLNNTTQQRKQQKQSKHPSSRLEDLPYELILSILEYLDIASLISIASANSNIRHLVRTMPQVSRILQDCYATEAIARMLRVDTAQFYSIGDFMDAYWSFSCKLCKSSGNSEKGSFATDICLLRCCRVCRDCVMQKMLRARTARSQGFEMFEMRGPSSYL